MKNTDGKKDGRKMKQGKRGESGREGTKEVGNKDGWMDG